MMHQIFLGYGGASTAPNTDWTINGSVVAYANADNSYNEGAWITDTSFGSWSY